MNSSPIRCRFSSGSVTPSSRSRNRSCACPWTSGARLGGRGGGEGRGGRAGGGGRARRRGGGRVGVAHPGGLLVGKVVEESALLCAGLGLAELGDARAVEATAELLCHQLHAVADP